MNGVNEPQQKQPTPMPAPEITESALDVATEYDRDLLANQVETGRLYE